MRKYVCIRCSKIQKNHQNEALYSQQISSHIGCHALTQSSAHFTHCSPLLLRAYPYIQQKNLHIFVRRTQERKCFPLSGWATNIVVQPGGRRKDSPSSVWTELVDTVYQTAQIQSWEAKTAPTALFYHNLPKFANFPATFVECPIFGCLQYFCIFASNV